MDKIFFADKDNIKATLAGGILREVLAYDDNVMTSYWEVPADAEIPPHSHPHMQMSIVLEGEAVYVVGDKEYTLKALDSVVMPSNVPHQVKPVTAIKAIDIFSPIREDFLK